MSVGVGPGGEDKDDGHRGLGRLVDGAKVEHGRLDVHLSHSLDDELGDCDVDPVDAEAAQNHHPTERRELFAVPVRHRRRLGRLQVVPRPPLVRSVADVYRQRRKLVAQGDETLHVMPAAVRQKAIAGWRVRAFLEREVALEEEI